MSTSNKADPKILAWLDEQPEPDLTDPDNPEWTAEDFARAKGPESLPPEVLAAFPETLKSMARRGVGKKPRKLSQTLRIDPDVLTWFKTSGRGWQSRINAVLREAMERGR
jgi:uncharacterized protein (DUF4415 family)